MANGQNLRRLHPPKNTDEKDANGHPVPGPIDDAEARLAYVAVTRARIRLDLGGLSWIYDHPQGAISEPRLAGQ